MHRPLLKLRALSLVAIGALALLATSASAQLSIEITGAGANRIPVAIADFGGEAGLSRALTSVIRADLERSGLFKMIDASGAALTEASSPVYADWKARGADALADAFTALPGVDMGRITGALAQKDGPSLRVVWTAPQADHAKLG